MRSLADYKHALYALLPSGPIWPSQAGEQPVWDDLIDSIAPEFQRVDARGEDLIQEAIPQADGSTYPDELLEDWERVAGLPEPCTTVIGTETNRRQALIAKLRGPGSPTAAKFLEILAGYGITGDIVQGYYTIDSIDRTTGGSKTPPLWVFAATGSVTYNDGVGPDGATDADLLDLPLVTDTANVDIDAMADNEFVHIDFWAKSATGTDQSVDVRTVLRDGTTPTQDTITLDNTWRHYTYDVDVLAGVTTPELSFKSSAGSASFHVWSSKTATDKLAPDVIAGHQRRWGEPFGAGVGAGTPVGFWHDFAYGYMTDLTDRTLGEPSWGTIGSPTLTNDTAINPVTYQTTADELTTAGDEGLSCDFNQDTTTAVTMRWSFWVRSTSATDQAMLVRFKHGDASTVTNLSFSARDTWDRIEGTVDIIAGGGTPQIIIVDNADSGVFEVAQLRIGLQNSDIECVVSDRAPLHTNATPAIIGEHTTEAQD